MRLGQSGLSKLLTAWAIFGLVLVPLNLAAASQSYPDFALPYDYVSGMIESEHHDNDCLDGPGFESIALSRSTLPEEFWPEHDPNFDLRTYLVPEQDVVVLDSSGNHLAESLAVRKKGQRYFKFYVHPQSVDFYLPFLSDYAQDKTVLSATPLASHRSLIAWPKGDEPQAQPLFLKVTLDAVIGDVRRLLTRSQLERAYLVSTLLRQRSDEEWQRQGIRIIDEPVSLYLKGQRTGYTLRTMPALPKGHKLLPMFGIYSRGVHNQRPLLQQIVKKSKMAPKDFAREMIMRPLLHHMMIFAFEEGVVPSPHEQNVMIELTANDQWTGHFYYRDLGGFHISHELRHAAGKDLRFAAKSFGDKSFKFADDDLIGKIQVYLTNANFYAMQMALREIDPVITHAWVKKEVNKIVQAELYLRTGIMATTAATQKAAITKYIHRSFKCADFLRQRAAVGQ